MTARTDAMREEAKRLRAQAAKARRLAKAMTTDPDAKSLETVAGQLDAEARRLEGEPPEGGETQHAPANEASVPPKPGR